MEAVTVNPRRHSVRCAARRRALLFYIGFARGRRLDQVTHDLLRCGLHALAAGRIAAAITMAVYTENLIRAGMSSEIG